MSKPQRIVALVAVLAIVAACGGSATSPAPSSPPASPQASAAASPSGPAEVMLPEPEKSSVTMALTVVEPSQFAPVLAKMAGIFEKNGLDVEYAVFEGDGKGFQAQQAGQVDLGFGGLTIVIQSQTTDAPHVTTMVNASILADLLMSTADIKNADDLRGKCVAVSTFGGTSHGAVILSLEAIGLTPEDVVITEVGGQSARIAAVQAGSCAAAPIDANQRVAMEEFGLNTLVDLKAERLPYGRTGMRVSEEWLSKYPNTALVVAASVLEAQNLMWTDPDLAAGFFAEYAQIELEDAKALMLDFQEVGNRQMDWTEEVFTNPQRVLGTVSPEILEIPAEDAWDFSLIDQLDEMGYYEKLGIPRG